MHDIVYLLICKKLKKNQLGLLDYLLNARFEMMLIPYRPNLRVSEFKIIVLSLKLGILALVVFYTR